MQHDTRTWAELLHGLYDRHEASLFMVMVVLAAVSFTVGGIFMKLSDGLSKWTPTLALFGLFIVGACLQTMAMKREDLAVTYLIVLGLEAVLAFLFGVFLFDESTSFGRVSGVALVAIGIAALRFSP